MYIYIYVSYQCQSAACNSAPRPAHSAATNRRAPAVVRADACEDSASPKDVLTEQ